MSLTEAALRKRMWGEFPLLANVLADKQPDTLIWYGASSVSDNVFSRVERELTRFALLNTHVDDIKSAIAAAPPEEAARMSRELDELHHRLKSIALMFDDYADQVRRIRYEVERDAESLAFQR